MKLSSPRLVVQKNGGPKGPLVLSVAQDAGEHSRIVMRLFASVLLVAVLVVLAAGQALAVEDSSQPQTHPREKTFMKRQWGVEVLFVRETAAGYMLEFRYKVLDPEKAKPLFDRQTKPVLVHESSGARFVVPTPPKTGALRNSNPPLADHTYWMFFANPGNYVKSGDLVTIEIGAFVAKGLVVE